MRHKEKALKNPCPSNRGTHGCRKQKGHLGKHHCQPGCAPWTDEDEGVWE